MRRTRTSKRPLALSMAKIVTLLKSDLEDQTEVESQTEKITSILWNLTTLDLIHEDNGSETIYLVQYLHSNIDSSKTEPISSPGRASLRERRDREFESPVGFLFLRQSSFSLYKLSQH